MGEEIRLEQQNLTSITGDVITTPSVGMLDAIRRATLNDDVYGEDQTTSAFEREMAAICGKEAAAFVITGTMANQLALRTLLNEAPPYAIMTDAQSRKLLLFFYRSIQGESRDSSHKTIPRILSRSITDR